MSIWIAKCEACGDSNRVFPDQVQKIKANDNLTMHKYCKEKLAVGSAWFCIKCDASEKDGTRCKIEGEVPADTAKKLIAIRGRETNLKGMGFILPSTSV